MHNLQNDELTLILYDHIDGDENRGQFPSWHFYICDHSGHRLGFCDLRTGYNENLYYGGHIGYHIYEAYRGHHYAAKACQLLFTLARQHHMPYLYITCNPDNIPSRKTCEYLCGTLLGIAELPMDSDLRLTSGETHKCIFQFVL